MLRHASFRVAIGSMPIWPVETHHRRFKFLTHSKRRPSARKFPMCSGLPCPMDQIECCGDGNAKYVVPAILVAVPERRGGTISLELRESRVDAALLFVYLCVSIR